MYMCEMWMYIILNEEVPTENVQTLFDIFSMAVQCIFTYIHRLIGAAAAFQIPL